VDSQLILYPSNTLWIGIHNSVQGTLQNGGNKGVLALGIVVPDMVTPVNTSWTGNFVEFRQAQGGPLIDDAPVPANEYWGRVDWLGDQSLIMDVWWLTLTAASASMQGVGILDAKELHCDFGPSDDTIYLLNGDDNAILDSITIHQAIPEPATIALLGLGGLLLRRRK
jgi:hypothetical protein